MLQTSRYLNGGSPLACANCTNPFPLVDNHFQAWRGQDQKFYCREDCEADALEAKARRSKVFS